MTHESRLDPLVERIIDDIAPKFASVFSRETIEQFVMHSYEDLSRRARVTTYVAGLTQRFAIDRLRDLARAEGKTVSDKPEVLFVCVHNAGRSQMAAGLLHHHAQDRVIVRSAGSAPVETINPAVVEVMTEVGIDLSQEFPKPLTDEAVRAADVVITMGCGDACPVYPGKRYLNWELADPAGQTIADVRPIRDEIDRRVRALLAELLKSPAGR
ncbi:MAG: arsenate reductase ArsC [bacterium]